MMPWRPYRAEGVVDLASHYHFHRVDNAARRQHGGLECITTKLIVGMVEHIHSQEASFFKAHDELYAVNGLDTLLLSSGGLE